MGHPNIENHTPFAFEALFAADEDGRPVVAPILKATFDVLDEGRLELAEEQIAPDFVGSHHGEPGSSSYRLEPEFAFMKPATDVALVGHAHAPGRRVTEMEVALRVGPVGRRLLVTGDRVWSKRLFGISATPPEPFEKMPLTYERAYGGWDRSRDDAERHSFHPGNPVGVGYRGRRARFEEGSRLPNIEDPGARLKSYKGKSVPAGFGFLCPNWEPRSEYAGTYDDAWSRTRMPLLPRDFDRRFFNAASPGLVAKGYLRGDEPVLVRGASREGELKFRLPGVTHVEFGVVLQAGEARVLEGKLDTVILDLDERKLILLWRSFTALRFGPPDVIAFEVTANNAPEPRAAAMPPGKVVSLPKRSAA